MNIVIASIVFIVGVIVGAAGTWQYMSYQWKHNPYRLKTIVDGVIALREARKDKE